MVLTNEAGSQARLAAFRYARGNTAAVIEVTTGPITRAVQVQFGGISESRASGLCMAISRLMLGGVVMDGSDFRAIYDSLDNARGLASELAPQETAATLAIASIEQASQRMQGCVS